MSVKNHYYKGFQLYEKNEGKLLVCEKDFKVFTAFDSTKKQLFHLNRSKPVLMENYLSNAAIKWQMHFSDALGLFEFYTFV